ncbi:GtrA family protein [Arthrobacter sp. CJ23]|uniref:GtrA family protein n=1 Tax=Arthrobacter sp. CJ23 TaxID=2972479 RepID=UPI00215C1904|nr:GtrA family protein [Arthrobacter sp. CJ23]UVJ38302.1 GtrA family protein [Arthrobacter sp. CJ23]
MPRTASVRALYQPQVVFRIMRDKATGLVRRLWNFGRNSHLVKFLIVGVASFAIDLGILALLHDGAHVDLWIATPVAFAASLVFNFYVQKKFTFESGAKAHVSFLKYGSLVVFNLIATDVIVNVIAGAGHAYAIGKIVSTLATTGWNFLLYKYWIFKDEKPATSHDAEMTADGTPASSRGD